MPDLPVPEHDVVVDPDGTSRLPHDMVDAIADGASYQTGMAVYAQLMAQELRRARVRPDSLAQTHYETCKECRYWLGLVIDPCPRHNSSHIRQVVREAFEATCTTQWWRQSPAPYADPELIAAVASHVADALCGTRKEGR